MTKQFENFLKTRAIKKNRKLENQKGLAVAVLSKALLFPAYNNMTFDYLDSDGGNKFHVGRNIQECSLVFLPSSTKKSF